MRARRAQFTPVYGGLSAHERYLRHRAPQPGHRLHSGLPGLRQPSERHRRPLVQGGAYRRYQRRDGPPARALRRGGPAAHKEHAHTGAGCGLRPHPRARPLGAARPGLAYHARRRRERRTHSQRGRRALRHALRRQHSQLRHADHRGEPRGQRPALQPAQRAGGHAGQRAQLHGQRRLRRAIHSPAAELHRQRTHEPRHDTNLRRPAGDNRPRH